MIDCLKDCPDLGACCKGFFLPITYLSDNQFKELMEHHKAPFKRMPYPVPERHNNLCYCPMIGDDGLCKDYEHRPQTCHIYQPGVESLCVLFVGPPEQSVMETINREDVQMLKRGMKPEDVINATERLNNSNHDHNG